MITHFQVICHFHAPICHNVQFQYSKKKLLCGQSQANAYKKFGCKRIISVEEAEFWKWYYRKNSRCTEWHKNYLEHYCSRVPNFTQFCSTIVRFPYNWVFDFPMAYNGEFEVFNNKSLKVANSKFRNPQLSLVTTGRKKQDKFENFWVQFVGGVAVRKFYSHC